MARDLVSRLLLSSPTITTTTEATPMPEYSDMVIIFICLLCALVCVVGVLGVVRWTCLKRPLSAISTTNNNDQDVPSEFFKKKVVESLPKLTYNNKSAGSLTSVSGPAAEAGEADCAICLSEFVDGDEIRVLPRCNHVFHVACIDTWLIGSQSFCCPSCRQTLVVKQCRKCKTGVSVNPSSLPPQPEADYLP
ncbi:hypothetical protein RND81_13G205300 [Saponaria officinalis]|uniref:RING-type domain-containing protein n=1 Tax=Saponaria officinalis TaxID=3572 RepID=A0AAW1H5L5_SAPOF